MSIVYHTIVVLAILGLIVLIPAGIGGSLDGWSDSTFKQDWARGAIFIGELLLALTVTMLITISFIQVFK